jgi:transcription termination factor Rho
MSAGTRKEERLHAPADMARITQLRRVLTERSKREAMELVLDLAGKYPTNDALLDAVATKRA